MNTAWHQKQFETGGAQIFYYAPPLFRGQRGQRWPITRDQSDLWPFKVTLCQGWLRQSQSVKRGLVSYRSPLGSRYAVTIWHLHVQFLIGLWIQASTSNGFLDIEWRMWRNGWHDLKRPLNKGQGHSFWGPIDFSYDFL